jgi:phosphoenolpyruvate-protein kinase (PTS system EI component)
MHWLEHIENTKAKAEKKISIIKCLAHTTWGADQGCLLKVHQMIVPDTETVLKQLEPTHNKNVLCEAGMTTLTEMTKLSNTKATIRVLTNKSIR